MAGSKIMSLLECHNGNTYIVSALYPYIVKSFIKEASNIIPELLVRKIKY